MIQVSGLKIKFGQRAIIDGIDFASARGKTVAVMGKNGSGKSTLLKALAGLIDIAEGTVLINGASRQDVAVRSVHRMCEKREAGTIRLAYVFQKGGLFDSMNVFDNTAFGLVRMGADPEDVRERVLSSLKRVGLAGSENKLPSELSGGMQKRVGIAR
ncbi:MAG: ATP-binding cassette domain-containing protein, partial [Spirochaetia bacterium]|nr:ATP-binding cassette domain-containing protein [Spirochaetia bacterium]